MKTKMMRGFVLVLFVVSLVAGSGVTSVVMSAAAADSKGAAAGAGAAAGTATAAGISTGTIATGVTVAAVVALAVASGGGTSSTVSVGTPAEKAAGDVTKAGAAATAAVATALQTLDAQSTKDLASALTTLSTADQSALAQASVALSAVDYAKMAAYLAAGSNLAKQVDARSAEITAWMATLTPAGQAAVNTLFSNVATDTAKLAVLKTLFSGASTTELAGIKTMLTGAVTLNTDGTVTVNTAALTAIVSLVKTVGTGDVATIATAQAEALKTLLTSKHPGATIIITTTNHGNNIWTTVAHIR